MMYRATWFAAGAAAGAIATTYTRRKIKAVAVQIAPSNVARGAAGKARAKGHDLVEALREGRAAMRAKEQELRAEQDEASVALVAPPAQIIVLSDVRQLEELTRAAQRPRVSTAHPAGRRRLRRARG